MNTSAESSRKRNSSGVGGLLLLLGAAAVVNVLLIARVAALEYQPPLVPPRIISVGKHLPILAGSDPPGNSMTIRFSDDPRPTVLLVLRPGCVWCARNMTNVRSLIRDTSQRYRFVVISQGEPGLSKYLQEHELAVPAIMLPPTSAAFSDIWKAGTPQTIVVGSNGAVVKAWPGAYSGAVKAEVERYFGVRLASDVNTPL